MAVMLSEERLFAGRGITAFELKLLALLSMTIDHVGVVLYPGVPWLRCVGRIAFPLYCFLLTEGFEHTQDRRRYMSRMLVMGLVSEIPFDLAGKGEILEAGSQNVFFTLFVGLLMLQCYELARGRVEKAGVLLFAVLAAEVLRTDYGAWGVLLIWIWRATRGWQQMVLAAGWNLLKGIWMQWFGVIAVFLVSLYNGKQGKKAGIIFYLYYPVHLLVLYGISQCIRPGQ